jgi:hypothetical protein
MRVFYLRVISKQPIWHELARPKPSYLILSSKGIFMVMSRVDFDWALTPMLTVV